jgi:hypothetical protein
MNEPSLQNPSLPYLSIGEFFQDFDCSERPLRIRSSFANAPINPHGTGMWAWHHVSGPHGKK